MERIGIAASKIAKGNLFLYNFFVILITLLFSLLVFFICGTSIVVILVIFDYMFSRRTTPGLYPGWFSVMLICMICLAIVVGLFALFGVFRNIKFKKNK